MAGFQVSINGRFWVSTEVGGLGLAVAWLIVQQDDPTGGMLPIFALPSRDVAVGASLIIALGIVAGLWPALDAVQLKITDALRSS